MCELDNILDQSKNFTLVFMTELMIDTLQFLDKAISEGKTVRFSHNPELAEYAGSFTGQEWKYLQKNSDYLYLREEGEFWYAEK